MVSVGVWLVIDAVLDNAIASELDSGGDADAIGHAQSLRARGWALNATHPLRGGGPVGWPPIDATFAIRLDDSDLAFVLNHIRAAIGVTERIISSKQTHPQVRAEQRRNLIDLENAQAELSASSGS
jgi:hypothetical protein